jgi:hypothetical protein
MHGPMNVKSALPLEQDNTEVSDADVK